MGHVIYPVLVSEIECDKSLMTYLANVGEKMWIPIVGWYVNADGKDILIDSGESVEDLRKYYPEASREVQSFEDALGKLGKTPEDIDYIILTHLHHDHVGNAQKCKNAKVFVQKKELEYAYSPNPVVAGGYPKALMEGLNFITLDGPKELFPGIRVEPVPGHSPACQAVCIETDAGLAVISGFCCSDANFEVPEEMREVLPVFAPGYHTDPCQGFYNALKVKGMADILIPQHEMTFARMEKIPA